MTSTFDISRFPDLPPEVLKAFEAQQAALEASRMEATVERAARLHQEAVLSEKEGLISTLKELIEKLEGQVEQYRRAKFGPRSEKLDPDQLQLGLEDLETAIAETQEQIAAVEKKIEATQAEQDRTPRKPRKERKLPDTLPRVEQVIEPDSIACPCGCGDMVRIGEDRSERLDIIPARYQVIVTIRPRYACPRGRAGVVQAAAPAHLLEASWPTEALLAQIAVAKHSEHMPLNRQAVVMARHGVPIDRSVLADWMGRTGALIAPVVERMAVLLKTGSSRLYVDETTAPVLDPGRGRTKTGYLWAVLRDDRGWGGPAPPGVVFHYHPGRGGQYASDILAGFEGTIQVDAYGAYTHLSRPTRPGGSPLKLAYCWAHGRRKLIEAKPKAGSPIVDEALLRVAALYKIEDGIRGMAPDHRRAVRQERSRPLVDAFFGWLSDHAARVSRKSKLGLALAYMLKRQSGFRLFLEDGQVDIDSNLVENAIRSPLKLAYCWAHGRRKLIEAKPKAGSPIVDEALLRVAALYKIEDGIRGMAPDHRRAVRQERSRPLVDAFFGWLSDHAARVSRKSKLGLALAYMLKRQSGFRLFLEDGQVDIDSNLVENAIRSPAMNRRNALFAGHDEGGRSWARMASLIGTAKMNGIDPYAYLVHLFTRLAQGHLNKDIDALMPWAYAAADSNPSQ